MKNNKLLENLIYLSIFLLPLYLARVKIWFIPTNILEIIIILMAVFILLFDKGKIDFEILFLRYKKYIYATAVILVGLLLSAFLNGNNQESWGIIKSWFLIPIIFLLICGRIVKKENINKIFQMYFYSSAVLAIISLGYFFLGQITYDGRLAGLFPSPNYLAMYLSPAVIIFMFQEKKNKIKMIIPFGIIGLALYFTYSYAGWLAIVISLAIVFFLKNKKKFTREVYFKFVALFITTFLLFFSQINEDKFNNLITFNERSSLASRMMIWKSSLKMIENNFWLGIGAGNFQSAYLEYQKFFPPYLNWAVSHPNNLYLTWWLYGGVLGLIGFFALIFSFFGDALNKKQPPGVVYIALGIMLVILIHGFFDTTYFKNDLAIVFWLNFLILKD